METTVSKFSIIHFYGPESDATASHSFMQMLQGSTFMEKLNEDGTPYVKGSSKSSGAGWLAEGTVSRDPSRPAFQPFTPRIGDCPHTPHTAVDQALVCKFVSCPLCGVAPTQRSLI